MKIGELAKKAGVTARTIRYYEDLNLLGTPRRRSSGFREYDDEILKRLEKIQVLKDIGLSLDQIADVIDLYFEDETGIKGKRKVLEILRNQLEDVDKKIDSLMEFKAEIKFNIKRIEKLISEIK